LKNLLENETRVGLGCQKKFDKKFGRGCVMKRITIVVPDKIIRQHEVRRNTYRTEIDVTPENILNVLTYRSDYHHDFFFKKTQGIIVESIEDVDEPND